MQYTTTAIVGNLYITDTGYIVRVESTQDRWGTVRFCNGWLIAYSIFEDCYTELSQYPENPMKSPQNYDEDTTITPQFAMDEVGEDWPTKSDAETKRIQEERNERADRPKNW